MRGFQTPIDPKTAPEATVLGQARGRVEGDSWTQQNPDGTRVVNTIPAGNGNQTVDQVVYDKSGREVSRARVVANTTGGYQRWASTNGGDAQYSTQEAPGADVTGLAWRPGIDTRGTPPYSTSTSSWDGARSQVETVDAQGRWSRVDRERHADGSWASQTTTADGAVTLAHIGADGKSRVTGQLDATGTGWVDDGNGGRAQVHHDEHGHRVTVATNTTTGAQTTTYTDPVTGAQRSRVTDKTGREIGHIDYDQHGKPTNGIVVDGGVRTSWVNGTATITHDGTDPANKDWTKLVTAPDGTVTQTNTDGSTTVFNAAGNQIKHTEAPTPPDDRPWWRKAASGTGNFVKGAVSGSWGAVKGVGKAAWSTIKGVGGLVGAGGSGAPGVKDSWVGLGKGLGNMLWTYNPQVVAVKGLYDVGRTVTSKPGDYVAEHPSSRLAGMGNAWLGVDFRDFDKPGVDKAELVGQTVFGVGMLIVPVKGGAALKAGAKTTARHSPKTANAAQRLSTSAQGAAATARTALNRYTLNRVAKHSADIANARPHAPMPPGRATPDTAMPQRPSGPVAPRQAAPHTPATPRAATPVVPAKPGQPRKPNKPDEGAGRPLPAKVKDPAYLAKHYTKRADGQWYRKDAHRVDADGDRVPKLAKDGTIVGEKTVATAKFGKYDATVRAAATKTVEQLIAAREAARAALRAAIGRGDRAGKSAAHADLTRIGARLGEEVIPEAIGRRYPAHQFDVQQLQPRSTNPFEPAVFDDVYQITPRNGEPPFITVVEAKAPTAKLGHRKGVGRVSDKHFQQGRREYVESIIAAMRGSGDLTKKQLAGEIRRSLRNGSLRYEFVQARVDRHGQYTGYRHREFDVSP